VHADEAAELLVVWSLLCEQLESPVDSIWFRLTRGHVKQPLCIMLMIQSTRTLLPLTKLGYDDMHIFTGRRISRITNTNSHLCPLSKYR
jgi:hypothetical protein